MENRVIKFRAWDGYKMILPGELFGDVRDEHVLSMVGDLFFLYEESNGNWCPNTLSSRRINGAILMQFTGLTDKNGVEIYEGDIVRNWQGGWNVVVYKAPGFEATVSENESSLYTEEWWRSSEVIGNIYENPELLNP